MCSKTNIKIILICLTVLAFFSIGSKMTPIIENYDDFKPQAVYNIQYNYFFKSSDNKTVIKSFIPQSNSRQRISDQTNRSDSNLVYTQEASYNNNVKGIWNTRVKNAYHNIDYEFVFEGKDKRYNLPETFDKVDDAVGYRNPTQHIQSQDQRVEDLAKTLSAGAKNDQEIIKNIFNHVVSIPSAPIITLTDAVTAIAQNRASCNGKSRLFIALARNLGYASRIKGGIILENTNKRTSHVWAEILINNQWIPFDTLNGHFAYLPANYLEIYTGDEFLITHTSGIQFDYAYQIKKVERISFLKMNAEEIRALSSISLWRLVESGIIPQNALHLLLLLPIGGLLVAFLRNVVGIKTFGVFLPVLIAFSLIHTGFFSGIGLFVILILLVGVLSYPFDKIGLLYTPKLVISLSIMVSLMIIAAIVGIEYNIAWLTTLTFFPTIILTIAAERFLRATVEDGYKMAIDKLFQTLVATAICYMILSWSWLPAILIIFPECLLLIITMAMLLGRYIGIRWTEFYRFKPLFNQYYTK